MDVVRPAQIDDAPALPALLGQLGYPTSLQESEWRLRGLLGRRDAGALVAEVEAEIVGLATYQVFELIYRASPECRLTALVVQAEHRRRGLASRLLAAVEGVATEHGCFRLELNTRQGRPDALPFYTALGFVERRHRLVKELR